MQLSNLSFDEILDPNLSFTSTIETNTWHGAPSTGILLLLFFILPSDISIVRVPFRHESNIL